MTRHVSSSRRGLAALVIFLLALSVGLRAGLWFGAAKDLPLAALVALALLVSAEELAVLLALTVLVLNYQAAPSYALSLMGILVLLAWLGGRVTRVKPRVLAPILAVSAILIFYACLGSKLFLVFPFLPFISALLGALLAWIILEIWSFLGLPLGK